MAPLPVDCKLAYNATVWFITLDAAHGFSCRNRDENLSAFVGMVRCMVKATIFQSMVKGDTASKHG